MDVNLPRQGEGAQVEKRIIRAIREIRGETSPDGHLDAIALGPIAVCKHKLSGADSGREWREIRDVC